MSEDKKPSPKKKISTAHYEEFTEFLLREDVSIPDDLQSDIYFELRINSSMPWTTLANNVYGTQDLWWLICLTNKIYNPVNNPELGAVYKIISPDFVNPILAELKKLTNG